VTQDCSRHEHDREEVSTDIGSDRAFVRSSGSILTLIGEAKSLCRLILAPCYGLWTIAA
jgi:hypothetical protein